MAPGSLKSNWKDRASPLTLLSSISLSVEDEKGKNYGPHNPRLFSNGAQEYFDRYGGDITHLAKIGECGRTRFAQVIVISMNHSIQESQALS